MIVMKFQALYYIKNHIKYKIKGVFWDWLGTIDINNQCNISIRGFLQIFHSVGIFQGIVSNGIESDIISKLNDWNLSHYINIMATSNLGLPLKPHTHMIRYCLMHSNESFHETDIILYIGDSETDALMVENLNQQGIVCVFIHRDKLEHLKNSLSGVS